MSEPHYMITTDVDGEITCLGEQLIKILGEIQPFIKNLTWYASDIDSQNFTPIQEFRKLNPRKIGDGSVNNLINLCKNVDQFLAGVFLGLPEDLGNQLNDKYGTEDPLFQDIGEAVLEIRAFDTTFYIISTNDFNIIEALATAFHATPEVNPKFNNLLPKNQPEIDW